MSYKWIFDINYITGDDMWYVCISSEPGGYGHTTIVIAWNITVTS